MAPKEGEGGKMRRVRSLDLWCILRISVAEDDDVCFDPRIHLLSYLALVLIGRTSDTLAVLHRLFLSTLVSLLSPTIRHPRCVSSQSMFSHSLIPNPVFFSKIGHHHPASPGALESCWRQTVLVGSFRLLAWRFRGKRLYRWICWWVRRLR